MRKIFFVLVTILICALCVSISEATTPAEARYGKVIAAYRDYVNNHEHDEDAFDNLLGGISYELFTEPGVYNEDKAYELECSLAELRYLVKDCQLGYSFRDLNDDGIPELFILTDDHLITAIYSLANEAPVLVGAYWSRNRCVIDKAGTLYINGSSGASDSSCASYSFRGGEELHLIDMVGIESYDEKTGVEFQAPRYYRVLNGKKTVIDEEEANALWKKFPDVDRDNPTKDAGLIFTLIF